jgi:hypothetical protein
MTAVRERLPNRRASQQLAFVCNDLKYIATVSFYPDGRLAEIFISNAKAGSHSDSAAKDSAVVCSIALQFSVPLDVIRHALLRDARGVASSPLGVALDLLAEDGERDVIQRKPRKRTGRPTFVLQLRPNPGIEPVRALRAVLKHLLRRHGFLCLSVHEERR